MSENIFKRIDHLAIAVNDLEKAIRFCQDIIGLKLIERRETRGETTDMYSALLDAGAFAIVLAQGKEDESQVACYIKNNGQGVQHVAFEVEKIEQVRCQLSDNGVKFATDLLEGHGLKQIFTCRDTESEMMYEFIERSGEGGFQDDNVTKSFKHLEENNFI